MSSLSLLAGRTVNVDALPDLRPSYWKGRFLTTWPKCVTGTNVLHIQRILHECSCFIEFYNELGKR